MRGYRDNDYDNDTKMWIHRDYHDDRINYGGIIIVAFALALIWFAIEDY